MLESSTNFLFQAFAQITMKKQISWRGLYIPLFHISENLHPASSGDSVYTNVQLDCLWIPKRVWKFQTWKIKSSPWQWKYWDSQSARHHVFETPWEVCILTGAKKPKNQEALHNIISYVNSYIYFVYPSKAVEKSLSILPSQSIHVTC